MVIEDGSCAFKNEKNINSGWVITGNGRLPFYGRSCDSIKGHYYEVKVLRGIGKLYLG